ncbi:MAG: metallophosphoesterase [Chitinophagales bacterium]
MKPLLLLICLFFFKLSFSQVDNFKLFLIGDTGEDIVLEQTMTTFLDTISKYPNSATVFLGDNCYKKNILGIEKKGFDSSPITVKRLNAQLQGLNDCRYKGTVYFVPGNHDWWNVTNVKKGKRHLQLEESFIEQHLSQNPFIINKANTFLPDGGNLVAAVDLNNNQLKLIFLDTNWLILLQRDEALSKAFAQLDSILINAISHKQQIVVTAHHPIYTISKHSRVNSHNNLIRSKKIQDIYHPWYNSMRKKLDSILVQKNYPIIYACGHDHVLEYFQQRDVQYIISGSGSKSNTYDKTNEFNPAPGQDIPKNPVAKQNEGFVEVAYADKTKSITLFFFEKNVLKKELIKQ